MRIECFEDFTAWQEARKLATEIYQATRQGAFARDFGLANQIQRAAVSVMSNIAEGYERNSDNEFSRFLAIAKGSCAEVRSQLYIAYDIGYLEDEDFQQLMRQAESVGRLVAALRNSVERRKKA